MWAPKFWTPGMARQLLLAGVVIRTISGCEVPGLVTQCIRKSRSLNAGSSVLPKPGTTARPAMATSAEHDVWPAGACG